MKRPDRHRAAGGNQSQGWCGQKIVDRTLTPDRHGKTAGRSQKSMVIIFLLAGMLLIAHSSLLVAQNAPVKPEEKKAAGTETKLPNPEEKAARSGESKLSDLSYREEAVRKEEERLKVLKKELDEKIDKYTKLLAKLEETLKAVETAKGERYEHLIKAYEAMPNEDAAARLATLDEPTAVKIIIRMKSKKAGAVMAAMEPAKAAALTEGMMDVAKKFPPK